MNPITDINYNVEITTSSNLLGGVIIRSAAVGANAQGDLLTKVISNFGFQRVGDSIYFFSNNSVVAIINYQYITNVGGSPYTPVSAKATATALIGLL